MPEPGTGGASFSERFVPFGVSALVHAGVIGAGFALVWTVRALPEPKHATDATVVHFAMPALAETPSPTRPDAAQPAREPADEPPTAQTPNEPPYDPPDDPLAGLFDEPAEIPGIDLEQTFDQPLAQQDGAPPADLLPQPEPPATREATFFDSQTSAGSDARRIVYVIDASGSTTALFPAIAAELERSLLALRATQLATIVVAQGDPETGRSLARAAPAPNGKEPLRRATGTNARRLAGWFRDEVRPAGRSDFVPALERALAMRPDAVFLLAPATDPALIDATRTRSLLEALDELNPIAPSTGRRRSLIAIVHIGALYEGDPLSAIAAEHSGDTPMTPLTRSRLLEAP